MKLQHAPRKFVRHTSRKHAPGLVAHAIPKGLARISEAPSVRLPQHEEDRRQKFDHSARLASS